MFLLYIILVAFLPFTQVSGHNELCINPTSLLRLKRHIHTNQSYTCSDDLMDFTCKQEGSFPDLADTSCTWYFECVLFGRGVFLHRYVQCPKHYKFSPHLQSCSRSYKCPCDDTLPAITPEPDWWCTDTNIPTFKCETSGRFPDLRDNTCKQYFLCSKYHNNTWLKTSYNCPNSAVFNPVTSKCNSDYTCPCLLTTTAPTTTITPRYYCQKDFTTYVAGFHCTKIGRYPDLGDTQCQKYFLCSKLRNETWIKTRYTCSGSTFDPILKKCSLNFKCPCYEATTPSGLVTTETTLETCIPSATPFKCSSKGRFADLSDLSCKNYFLCSQLRNGTWLQTNYTCTGSSLFDPSTQKCSSQYKCVCSSETTTEIAITTPSQCSTSIPEFTCSTNGRFPDKSDLECRKYFLCSQLKNGTLVRKTYKCTGSTFDPDMKKCSITYSCPCSTETTTPSQGTTLSTCSPPSEPLPDFMCRQIGRYPDLGDPNCRKYFLCSLLHNGTWIKTRYSCKDSTFAPEIQRCHISYSCPCLAYYTTPMSSNTLKSLS